MKYEWKKGDKLVIVDSSDNLDNGADTGLHVNSNIFCNKTIVTADADLSSDNDSTTCYAIFPNGLRQGFSAKRFQKFTGPNPSLKAPTHLVIWDENSRDPHKFFVSVLEANNFIKQLIEKPEVKKDSIVLVEIKKSEKVAINKFIRKSKFTILN